MEPFLLSPSSSALPKRQDRFGHRASSKKVFWRIIIISVWLFNVVNLPLVDQIWFTYSIICSKWVQMLSAYAWNCKLGFARISWAKCGVTAPRKGQWGATGLRVSFSVWGAKALVSCGVSAWKPSHQPGSHWWGAEQALNTLGVEQGWGSLVEPRKIEFNQFSQLLWLSDSVSNCCTWSSAEFQSNFNHQYLRSSLVLCILGHGN